MVIWLPSHITALAMGRRQQQGAYNSANPPRVKLVGGRERYSSAACEYRACLCRLYALCKLQSSYPCKG